MGSLSHWLSEQKYEVGIRSHLFLHAPHQVFQGSSLVIPRALEHGHSSWFLWVPYGLHFLSPLFPWGVNDLRFLTAERSWWEETPQFLKETKHKPESITSISSSLLHELVLALKSLNPQMWCHICNSSHGTVKLKLLSAHDRPVYLNI